MRLTNISISLVGCSKRNLVLNSQNNQFYQSDLDLNPKTLVPDFLCNQIVCPFVSFNRHRFISIVLSLALYCCHRDFAKLNYPSHVYYAKGFSLSNIINMLTHFGVSISHTFTYSNSIRKI